MLQNFKTKLELKTGDWIYISRASAIKKTLRLSALLEGRHTFWLYLVMSWRGYILITSLIDFLEPLMINDIFSFILTTSSTDRFLSSQSVYYG